MWLIDLKFKYYILVYQVFLCYIISNVGPQLLVVDWKWRPILRFKSKNFKDTD